MSDWGPMQAYRHKVEKGELRPDPAQMLAVEMLETLYHRLKRLPPRGARNWLRLTKPQPVPRGLYLYGGVGRGKSMLMDLLFETAPVKLRQRVHFHAFMQRVHTNIRAAREAGLGDPIPPVADRIAESAQLLCFDEVQVTDIADAMLLGRLFDALFARQVVIVATSNRHPRELYKNGLNRALFLPFIERLEAELDIHHLDGPTDFRLARLRGFDTWITGPDRHTRLSRIWRELTGTEAGDPARLHVAGRDWRLAETVGGVARDSFEALCEQPLGAADYLALAGQYHTLFLTDLPLLLPSRRNAARRLVTLIDALYEAKARLIVTAEAEPAQLYPEGDGAFEFQRTVSRLEEMRSADWQAEFERAHPEGLS